MPQRSRTNSSRKVQLKSRTKQSGETASRDRSVNPKRARNVPAPVSTITIVVRTEDEVAVTDVEEVVVAAVVTDTRTLMKMASKFKLTAHKRAEEAEAAVEETEVDVEVANAAITETESNGVEAVEVVVAEMKNHKQPQRTKRERTTTKRRWKASRSEGCCPFVRRRPIVCSI